MKWKHVFFPSDFVRKSDFYFFHVGLQVYMKYQYMENVLISQQHLKTNSMQVLEVEQ